MWTTSEIIWWWPKPEEKSLDILKGQKNIRNSLKEEIIKNPDFIFNLDSDALNKNLKITDGKLKLFWKELWYWINLDWNLPNDFLQTLSKEHLEKNNILEKNEKLQLLSEIVSIWWTEAMKVSGSLWFKFRDDERIIKEQTQNVMTLFQEIESGIFTLDTKEFDYKINQIFNSMFIAEEQEDIIWTNDIIDVKTSFFNSDLQWEEKLISILHSMRYGWWSGNSDGVKLLLEEQLLKKDDFSTIKEILKTPQIYEAFETGNTKTLIDYLGQKEWKKALKQYKKISEKIDLRSISGRDLLVLNQKRKEQGQEVISSEELMKLQKRNAIGLYTQSILLYKQIEQEDFRWNKQTTLKWMYANLSWLAENKWVISDWFVFSDENIDSVIEVWLTLALMWVTMWAGVAFTIWGRALMTGQKFANATNTGQKILNTTRIAWNWTKLQKVWTMWKVLPKVKVWWVTLMEEQTLVSVAWLATLDGITFYEWINLASNLIHKKNISEMFDWSWNMWEIWKSILFMKLLNVHFRWMATFSATKFSQTLTSQVPKGAFTKILGSLSSFGLTTGAIYSIWWIIEELFWQWWEPTWKEYWELFVLLAIFHTWQKYKVIEKSKKWISKLKPKKKDHYIENTFAY